MSGYVKYFILVQFCYMLVKAMIFNTGGKYYRGCIGLPGLVRGDPEYHETRPTVTQEQ